MVHTPMEKKEEACSPLKSGLNFERRLVGVPPPFLPSSPSSAASIKNERTLDHRFENRSAVNSEEIESRPGGNCGIPADPTCGRSCYLPIIAAVAAPNASQSTHGLSSLRGVDHGSPTGKGSFDMWGSGQEIVSRVRATGVKQGNRKLSLSLSEDFRPVFIYVGT